MTIAAAYLVSDGVVLGADSSTTVAIQTQEGGSGVIQLLNHAQKVFEVGESSKIGVSTWGAGSIGLTSHRTVIAKLADQLKKDTSVNIAAETLGGIVEPLVREAGVPFVGYYLGGWDAHTHEPACFRIEVTQGGARIEPLSMGLCMFSGTPQFFSRVFKGYDPRLPENLLNEIVRLLPQDDLPKKIQEVFPEAFTKAAAPLVSIGFKDLPIREAIDFVYSYLHITIKALKFSFGAPACGGPIEVGFITTDRPFRWARHKRFESAIIAEETQNEFE